MSREANSEQRPAIEHRGGKLLSAGAGSGKTFVLVEHVKHLTRLWAQEWKNQKENTSLEEYLAQKYSSVVLMTFTRLAASEIHVRLSDQINLLVEASADDEKNIWKASQQSLGFLSVTTIDGFFYKLVRLGYFPGISPETPIIMYEAKRKVILGLFEQWWEENLTTIPFDYQRDASMYRKELSESFVKIMSDPALRISWMDFRSEKAAPNNLKDMLLEISALCGWNDFIKLSVEIPDEARKNKWVALADALNERRRPIENWDDLLDWYEFCQTDIAKTRQSFGKSKALVEDYFSVYNDFKDSVLKWGEEYLHYQTHFEEKIKPWLTVLCRVVQWLDKKLDANTGLTYGDLEYEVLKNLKKKKIRERIAQDFHYFIVDEFQDTSLVQFEALHLLTLNKLDKLFCVGDIKQAIYGFRGGELAVFNNLSEALGKGNTLEMSANYRSEKEVIEFNNNLFSFLFPLGGGWKGQDAYSVKMTSQNYPHPPEHSGGKVTQIILELPSVVSFNPESQSKKNPKWRLKDLDQLEAEVFADFIQDRLKENPESSIAILYRKLEPSRLLVQELIKRDIGFTSQAKVPYNQDPLSGMLFSLIQDILANKESRWSSYMVKAYLSILGVSENSNLAALCSQFKSDFKLYGITTSFLLFLERIHLSNSLPEGNLQALLELMSISGNDLEAIYQRLKAKADLSWSANFRFGSQAQRVVIQSAHASKGLEYDIVLLGGSFTNGRSKGERDWAGSFPGATLWIENPHLRGRKKTLNFLFESLINKHKLFSESKRLLYVACTRAKRELVLLRVQGPADEIKLDENSWAKAIDLYLANHSNGLELRPFDLSQKVFDQAHSMKPFFHSNNLGMFERVIDPQKSWGIIPEISVTKLNSLLECPRQFFYKTVLKLDENEREKHWGDEVSVLPLSSSQRGSDIHLALSEGVTHHLQVPLRYVNHPYKEQIAWALSEVQKILDLNPKAELISEKPMKFPFFGFMLSGIPDLVIRDLKTQIWDYKTGKRKPETEKKYWQQLMIYAYALWSTKIEGIHSTIKLTLCYVDEKEIHSREVSWENVRAELFPLWIKLSDLSSVNTESCLFCPYQEICPR